MSNKLGEYLRELRGKESLRSVAERSNGELSHSYISDLEKGVSRRGNIIKPSPDVLKSFSNVYNTNYNYLMSLAGYSSETNNEPYYSLTEKEKSDIAVQADALLEGIESGAEVNFYGEPATDEQKERLRVAIRTAMEMNKEEAKKKFTNKKYRD